MYRSGFKYEKAGVMLMDLQTDNRHQLTLDLDASIPENRIRLIEAMDIVNQRFGRGTIKLDSAGTADRYRVWSMKQERLPSGFTTDWWALATAS